MVVISCVVYDFGVVYDTVDSHRRQRGRATLNP